MTTESPKPEVTQTHIVSMQVCVPADWTDEQAKAFADRENPSGMPQGWFVRKDSEGLAGDPERNPCKARPGCVHIMLDC